MQDRRCCGTRLRHPSLTTSRAKGDVRRAIHRTAEASSVESKIGCSLVFHGDGLKLRGHEIIPDRRRRDLFLADLSEIGILRGSMPPHGTTDGVQEGGHEPPDLICWID